MKRQRTPLSYLLSAQTALSRRSRNVVASRDYSVNLSVPLRIVEAVCPFGAWINDLTDTQTVRSPLRHPGIYFSGQ